MGEVAEGTNLTSTVTWPNDTAGDFPDQTTTTLVHPISRWSSRIVVPQEFQHSLPRQFSTPATLSASIEFSHRFATLSWNGTGAWSNNYSSVSIKVNINFPWEFQKYSNSMQSANRGNSTTIKFDKSSRTLNYVWIQRLFLRIPLLRTRIINFYKVRQGYLPARQRSFHMIEPTNKTNRFAAFSSTLRIRSVIHCWSDSERSNFTRVLPGYRLSSTT